MRRPWIEAAPMLAAAGCTAAAIKPLHPLARSLRMAATADFAFMPRLDAVTRPYVFPTALALARHIERKRTARAMELVDVEDIEIEGRAGLYTGVQVWTLYPDGGRDECLGWAWLNGRGRDRLEPALRSVRRDVSQAEAA